jgi:hypothetical protein
VDAIAGITYLVRWFNEHSSGPRESARSPRREPPSRQVPLTATQQPAAPPATAAEDELIDYQTEYRSDPLIAGTHYVPDDEESGESLSPPSPGEARYDLGILDQMGILSLGDGTIEPSYWLENFNLSTTQLQMLPTNPLVWNFYSPPAWLALDAPTKNIDDYARALIGPNRYMRVNPTLLALPTLVASGIARFPWYRGWLTDYLIPNAVSSQPSKQAVDWAARFLEQQWWLNNDQAGAAM